MDIDFNREVHKDLGIFDDIFKLFLDIRGHQILRGFSAYTGSFFLKIYP
jgi:hypothetical protein